MMLDAELIRRVDAVTKSLSAAVEDLLASYVQAQVAKQPMAQFDICRNKGRSRAGFPYDVIVQSGEFENTARQDLGPVVASLADDESASMIVHQIDRVRSRVYP